MKCVKGDALVFPVEVRLHSKACICMLPIGGHTPMLGSLL